MKRISTLICLLMFTAVSAFATDHTIVTQGLAYMPSSLTVAVGDNVTIVATGNHPTTQVSQASWDNDEATPLAGGFGTNSSSFTFEITSIETIYYVCDSHVGAGMKGLIMVSPNSLDELSESVQIDLGAMPIVDGRMNYTIAPTTLKLGQLEVIGINGKRVAVEAITSNRGTMELNAAKGQYIVLLRDDQGRIVFRESIAID